MERPELLFVTGCNAAGKSSLIRTHLSQFPEYEIIMTDVYKNRSLEVFKESVASRKNIILETPFNNEVFKDLVDLSKKAGYQSTLIVLFLKSPSHSLERVAARRAFENGLYISADEVEYNFIENFKNVAKYFPYFDRSFFIYTGKKDKNELIMSFHRDALTEYRSNDFVFVQKFAEHAYQLQRLDKGDFDVIVANSDYKAEVARNIPNGFNWEQI